MSANFLKNAQSTKFQRDENDIMNIINETLLICIITFWINDN